MIDYIIDQKKTMFTSKFYQIVCEFSYSDKDEHGAALQLFGSFTVDVDWDNYFKDATLKRFLNTYGTKEWLVDFKSEPVLNDIFYNKLVEYISLAVDGRGAAIIEIEDEELIKDNIDDKEEADIYNESEEITIFNSMFNDAKFIEHFKDSLSNPAKENLLDAIEYFQKHQSIYAK